MKCLLRFVVIDVDKKFMDKLDNKLNKLFSIKNSIKTFIGNFLTCLISFDHIDETIG